MESNAEWENLGRDDDSVIGTETYRMAVPGGWLYRVVMDVPRGEESRQLLLSLTFVPNPIGNLPAQKSRFRPK